ncbi:hypothetical protein V1603_07925 [Enterobacter sp. ECC-219]|uniref:hypothetical protein n=1 Tax=Enterobacter sp. ECC-219 TaxID=3116480 RepID=UPI003754CDBE
MKQEKTYIYQWLLAVCYVPIIAPSKKINHLLPDSLNTSLEPLAIRSALRAALNDASRRDDVAQNKQASCWEG